MGGEVGDDHQQDMDSLLRLMGGEVEDGNARLRDGLETWQLRVRGGFQGQNEGRLDIAHTRCYQCGVQGNLRRGCGIHCGA